MLFSEKILDVSKIKALPITEIEIQGIKDGLGGNDLRIGGEYIMKESNLIIEDITARNSFGAEQYLYQKLTATIYYINQNSLIRNLLSNLKKQSYCTVKINLGASAFNGRPDAFASQGNSEIVVRQASVKVRAETTQGFLRYVLSISAFSKNPIDIYDYQ